MKKGLWKLLILMGVVSQLFVGCSILGLDDDDDDQVVLTSADSTLFVLSSTGTYIAAFNYISGEEIKQDFVELESESSASDFCVWEDKILVAATKWNALMVYSADDGEKITEIPLGDGVKPAFVIAHEGVAYVTASEGAKKLHKVDLNDYTVTSVAGGDCLQNIYYNENDNLLYINDIENMYSPAGQLLVISPESLATVQTYETISQNPQGIAYYDGSLFVACSGQSWGTPVDGAIDRFDASGIRSATRFAGKYPSCLVEYHEGVYANAGFGVAGLFNVQDTSDQIAAIDYSVVVVVAKGDYLATTQSNWTSPDNKAHLYIYDDGVLWREFEIGDSPSCVRFYKK